MTPDVLIAGAGVSGLSAATALSLRGHSVLLIEQRPRCGGRTITYFEKNSPDEWDNGQHLMMGCCSATVRYLESIGTLGLVRRQPALQIYFRDPALNTFHLNAGNYPPPFHLLPALLKFDALTLSDRFRLGLFFMKMRSGIGTPLEGETVAHWLDRNGQTSHSRKYFWDILTIATLNEEPIRASAELFQTVLRAAFFGSTADSAMIIPQEGLSRVLVDGALDLLRKQGCVVRTGMKMTDASFSETILTSVSADNGTVITPRAFIFAVPHFDYSRMMFLRNSPLEHSHRSASNLHSSPIVSVDLQFGQDFFREDFIALIDSPVQWIFNRPPIRKKNGITGTRLSLVMSAAANLIEMTKDEITAMSLNEIERFFPEAKNAVIVSSRVLKERRATFSPYPAADDFRPAHRTSVHNVFLAGDWTATGLPATIEGAIRSGYACAELADKYLRAAHS